MTRTATHPTANRSDATPTTPEEARRPGLNGVDVEKLGATLEALKAKPELARFQFRAKNRWVDGGHNRSEIGAFYGAGTEDAARAKRPFVMDNDEPPLLLGEDRGANPVEQVLHGLAGCLTTSLVYHAAARGIRIDSVESRLEGDLDLRGFLGISDDVRNGYEKIRVTFDVKGDATPEQVEELVQLAQKRSPVFDVVSRPVPVEVKVGRVT
jgi:uncharacterized OsmC-like protein